MNWAKNRIVLVLFAVFLLPGSALGGSISALERGNPDRSAVLDAIRPAIEAITRGKVEFVVRRLDSADHKWAFAVLDPQRPGGVPIDPNETSFAEDIELMDGMTVYALTVFDKGRWHLLAHDIGPTDVSWTHWPHVFGVPAGLMGLTSQ